MAMSELKQRLIKHELAQIGYLDARYIPESDQIKLQPDNDHMPFINDVGDINYGTEYDGFVMNMLRPLVDKVNEMTAAWDKTHAAPYEDISNFRILAEYNNIVLAARDDSKNGYGLHFVTWEHNQERASFYWGHYTTDYYGAKEDFAVRAGLIDKAKIITPEQAVDIKATIDFRTANDDMLTFDTEKRLNEISAKLSNAFPEINAYSEKTSDKIRSAQESAKKPSILAQVKEPIKNQKTHSGLKKSEASL